MENKTILFFYFPPNVDVISSQLFMSQDQNFDLLKIRLNSSFVSAMTHVIRERQPEGGGPKLMLDKIFKLKCIN